MTSDLGSNVFPNRVLGLMTAADITARAVTLCALEFCVLCVFTELVDVRSAVVTPSVRESL